MPLTIDEVTSLEGFRSLAPEWEALVDRLELPSPFQTWAWNFTWWAHFSPGGRRRSERGLRILVFRRGSEIVGIAPLHERRYGIGPVAGSLLAPLGWEGFRGKFGLTEINAFLFPQPDRSGLLSAFAAWLARQPRWLLIWVPGLSGPSELPPGLASLHVRAREFDFHHRDLPSDWPSFVSGLNKSMRDNVKYYPRLLERRGHRYRFQVAATPAEVTACLSVFLDLHRARAVRGSGIPHVDKFRWPRRRSFLEQAFPLLAGAGVARLGILQVDDRPVAAQLWLEHGRTMFLYYSGYDPAWSEYSVAMVATAEAFKDAIGRGLQRVEFLRGHGQFKTRWDTTSRRSSNLLLARNPGIVSRLDQVRRALAGRNGSARWVRLPIRHLL